VGNHQDRHPTRTKEKEKKKKQDQKSIAQVTFPSKGANKEKKTEKKILQ
jgi:hypothetical protein